jgi:hypothetical protein
MAPPLYSKGIFYAHTIRSFPAVSRAKPQLLRQPRAHGRVCATRNARKEPILPEASNYNLDYRPESYWDDERRVLDNVKGQWRRDYLKAMSEAGQLEHVPAPLFAESLSDEVRRFTGRIHPSLMGGEYLSDLGDGEVEIARVVLASTLLDVISLRARLTHERKIHLRCVDEYPEHGGYTLRSDAFDRPLTLGELIAVIDTTEHLDEIGLSCCFRRWQESCEPEELEDFVCISSEFYPELEDWYEEEAKEWVRGRRKWLDEIERE